MLGPLALALLSGLAVAGCTRPAPPAAAVATAAERPPVPAPLLSAAGCVESRDLAAYVRALDVQRSEARTRALGALGARPEERRGSFAEPGSRLALDQVEARGEGRFAVVGMFALGFEPVASLARQGLLLRRIDERPRAHAAPVLSCSERRCPRPRPAAAPSPVRPLLVELAPGEQLGEPLRLDYDYWRADVSYASAERCGAEHLPASSAASATP
ncbi:MAG TPA: hypothetical protein VNN80_16215 [Polyangiaceae bacterium]|nr:hypothetical protein [Polyangiaceae bacterium]